MAVSSKYYSMKARVHCGIHPYTGEAKMWILRGTDIKLWVVPYDVLEIASVLKTLPIIDGLLNATVEDQHNTSIKSYYLTIDDPSCCPKGVAHYKSLPYMAETFNYHDVKEVAQLHPYDLKSIELIEYCPGAQSKSIPQ
uniref:Gamma-glutamylcyclotransferase n=1 Tax=Panagrellus redivivus TaxID=6233 RepID=A0A7E4V5H7_PANRE